MPFELSFRYPYLLWLQIIPIAFAIWWFVQRHKRSSYGLQIADLDLLGSIARSAPTYKQIIPGIAALLSMVVMVVAIAGPQAEVESKFEDASVVLAFDTSISMLSEDVIPNRFDAAKEAAIKFVDEVPKNVRIGLVFFNQEVTVAVTPQIPREPIKQAIRDVKTNYGTALGDAITSSVNLLQADKSAYSLSSQDENPVNDVAKQLPTAIQGASIVVLSDGTTTSGTPAAIGAREAKDVGIPVSTISFGTKKGMLVIDGTTTPVPVNEKELKEIAEATKGTFARALDSSTLNEIFVNIGKKIGIRTDKVVFVLPWLLVSLGAAVIALATNLLWFRRAF